MSSNNEFLRTWAFRLPLSPRVTGVASGPYKPNPFEGCWAKSASVALNMFGMSAATTPQLRPQSSFNAAVVKKNDRTLGGFA